MAAPHYALSIERGRAVLARAVFCGRDGCDAAYVTTTVAAAVLAQDLRQMGWALHPARGWLCDRHAVRAAGPAAEADPPRGAGRITGRRRPNARRRSQDRSRRCHGGPAPGSRGGHRPRATSTAPQARSQSSQATIPPSVGGALGSGRGSRRVRAGAATKAAAAASR